MLDVGAVIGTVDSELHVADLEDRNENLEHLVDLLLREAQMPHVLQRRLEVGAIIHAIDRVSVRRAPQEAVVRRVRRSQIELGPGFV